MVVMKRVWVGFMAGLVAVLSGCAHRGDVRPHVSKARLIIENGTHFAVCGVELDRDGAAPTSIDMTPIPPGAAATFSLVPGVWSVALLDCSGEVMHQDSALAIVRARRIRLQQVEVQRLPAWQRTSRYAAAGGTRFGF